MHDDIFTWHDTPVRVIDPAPVPGHPEVVLIEVIESGCRLRTMRRALSRPRGCTVS
mgnify:CR=1 FL=1